MVSARSVFLEISLTFYIREMTHFTTSLLGNLLQSSQYILSGESPDSSTSSNSGEVLVLSIYWFLAGGSWCLLWGFGDDRGDISLFVC
jgi:hypothetical protein